MPKTVADYEDAVRRIANANVDPNSTSLAEVERDLSQADVPQVTREVAQQVADNILTEERVLDAIEGTGELPSEAELDAITAVSDDYDMADRVDEVSEAVENRVATVEDVNSAVQERREQATDRPTFREDVEAAVDSVEVEKDVVGATPDEVVSEQAQELGAPSRQDYERARTQLGTGDEQVTAAGVLGDEATDLDGVAEKTANTPAPVINDVNGDPVALTGAPTQEAGEQMADELGTEYVSIDEFNEQIGLEQGGGEATLTFRGREVGEVGVE